MWRGSSLELLPLLHSPSVPRGPLDVTIELGLDGTPLVQYSTPFTPERPPRSERAEARARRVAVAWRGGLRLRALGLDAALR